MKYLFCFIILIFSGLLKAQGTYTVLVLDSITQEPVYGAKAVIKGFNTGAVTNESGQAIIRNVPNGTHTIVFSSIGYASKEERINPTSTSTATSSPELTEESNANRATDPHS